MPDIIVTTPKDRRGEAAAEARDCLQAGGGTYFRRFSLWTPPPIEPGEKLFYVEDGYVRGFGIVSRVSEKDGATCETTGRDYASGVYVEYPAHSWLWIRPIPMKGFQGWRYARFQPGEVVIVGTWEDSMPPTGQIELAL